MKHRALALILVIAALVAVTIPASAHRRHKAPGPAYTIAPTDENLDRLAQCESGSDPSTNTGNGYYGAFQFSLRTWRSMPERAGWPHTHTYDEQRTSARHLVERAGWRSQFPGCSRRLGLH